MQEHLPSECLFKITSQISPEKAFRVHCIIQVGAWRELWPVPTPVIHWHDERRMFPSECGITEHRQVGCRTWTAERVDRFLRQAPSQQDHTIHHISAHFTA